jgi:hypothetical protein
MNGHPEVVDTLAASGLDVVTLDPLLELAGSEEFPFPFDWESVRGLREDEVLGPLLERAYLPLLRRDLWAAALERADLDDRLDEDQDWVAFAAGMEANQGVSMPDDASPTLRISLFLSMESGARRIGLDCSASGRPVSASVSVARGCSLPAWGTCSEEECEGACGLRRVPERQGVICVCPSE